MAVFIFGAGATRGASFVDPKENPCLPPLNEDFFVQLQRIKNKKHQELIVQVLEDMVELFGPNFKITMENAFTILEHMMRMLETTGETRDFKKREIRQQRERLVQSIAAVFEEALTEEGTSRKPRECKYHTKFVADILKPRDSIISFNYDCLLDYTLKEHGTNKWNPRYGYGLLRGRGRKELQGEQNWEPDPPAEKDATVYLYKLHGSLHFWMQETKKTIVLKQRPYTKQKGNLRFTIIPPEWHKDYDKGPFKRLWRLAGKALHKTNALVFIGYSLPETDLHATTLFRMSVKKESLKSLVVVNPDKDTRYRIANVVKRGIGRTTRILTFDTLEEFVAVDRALWDLND